MPVPFANILQPLIDPLHEVLVFFHGIVGSWGLSIILLTVSVRLVLLPLTLKQVKSMQRLQLLAPELRKIQERYRHDKQRQQQEMMRFYQEHRVNPLASCLPLLLQLPFFIALFYMLQSDLRLEICGQNKVACADASAAQFASAGSTPGAESFLFIPDLTGRATGAVLVVLILIYVGSQVASGLLSTASMDRNQRLLMLALPVVFVFFIVNFPAGLLVYWITTNLWTIVQQLIVRKTVGLPQRPRADAAPAGAAALSAGRGGRVRPARRAAPAAERKSGGKDRGEATATAPRKGGPPPPRRKKKRSGRRR